MTCHAQIYDRFENALSGKWTQSASGRWDVTNVDALSGNKSLQHVYDNAESGHDQIALKHPLLMLDSSETTWSFRIRHGQDPSSSNNWCVFLATDEHVDQLTPENANNAYCLGVNFTGSDDLLKLWKVQDGSQPTLINTHFNWQDSIGTETAPYIEVKRSPSGDWEVLINANGDENPLTSLGSAYDNAWNSSATFGIYYAYTKTYDQALWFDDLTISGYFYQDSIPPRISKAYFLTDTLLKIQLSETYVPGSITRELISTGPENEIKQIITASHHVLHLVLDTNITHSGPLTLEMGSLTDLSGNVMPDTTIHVPFYPEKENDIRITEVMADPSPPVDLPKAEYLELYNASSQTINLYHWNLQVGNREFKLPDLNIEPKDYLIVCKNDQASEFVAYGNTLPVFTAVYTLRNESDTIILTNEKDELMNSFVYHEQFHSSQEKQDGGWSLEIIDPGNQCNPWKNWTSSMNVAGGTPGQVNSVNRFNRDTLEPGISSWKFVHTSELQLTFSEPVQISRFQASDFFLVPGMGNPSSIQAINDTMLLLTFENKPVLGSEYVLSINNITDLCGNNNANAKINIPYYKAYPFDVLITEIMADPTPGYGLPETEYIEVFNNSAFPLNLDQWQLMVNNNKIMLPSFMLDPGEQALVTNASVNTFADTIRMVQDVNLPVLPNQEGTIALMDSTSSVIHAVYYNNSWIDSEYKQDGGWSLEMIDPTNPCGGKTNWQECKYYLGGTPGWTNSVNDAAPDYIIPHITRIGYRNDSSIRVHFNKPLDTTTLNNQHFRVDDQHFPGSMVFEFPLHRHVDLYFTEPFTVSRQHTLMVSGGYADCAGNINNSGQELVFGKPRVPANNDIVFNEILFNPLPGGANYIELYNLSENIIDLQHLFLVRMDEKDEIQSSHIIGESSYLVYPGDYLLLTNDTSWLKANYDICPGILLETSNIPRLPNDEGHVAILNTKQETIDELHYSSAWHSGWINNESGVALERLHPESPTQQADNWTSGIAATHYGTPTCQNANSMENKAHEKSFAVKPKLFTPNGDGYNDETVFYYSLGKGNYMLHATIFNSNGQLITRLKQDEYVGHQGFFTWDGRNDQELLCPIGIYLVYSEFVSDHGHVKVFKTTCVLGKKVE